MASPVGVITVLGLSPGLCSGSLLAGFTGLIGEIEDGFDSADLGDAPSADIGEAEIAGAGEAVIADAGVVAGEGMVDPGLIDSAGAAGVTAGDTVDSDSDASLESEHAGFSAFPAETEDSCANEDLADALSVQVGFSALSAETGDTGDAACEIKEAAKTAPAVSKAERLKLMFSPKA